MSELAAGEISDPVYCTPRVLTRDPMLLRGGFAVLRVRERLEETEVAFEDGIERVRRAYAAEHRADLDREIQAAVLAEAGFDLLRVPAASEFSR